MQFFYGQKIVKGDLDLDVEGIFGLARMDQKMKLSPAATPENNKRQLLESVGDIFEKSFSTRFTTDDFSWIDVGSVNEKEKAEYGLDPLEVDDDFFWSMPMYGVKFKSMPWSFQSEPNAVMDDQRGVYTIFDTGTADIFISDLWYSDFLAKFFESYNIKNWEVKGSIVTGECRDF